MEIKIRPSLDDIKFENGMFVTNFDGVEIHWHVPKEVVAPSTIEKFKRLLFDGMAMVSNYHQLADLLEVIQYDGVANGRFVTGTFKTELFVDHQLVYPE